MRSTKLGMELKGEVELLCQYGMTYPYAALHVSWQRRTSMKMRKITGADVMAMAQQSPEGSMAKALPDMMMDPLAEDSLVEMLLQWKPHLTRKRARRVVRDLRNTGSGEWPEPVVVSNQPCLVALAPYRDILLPPGTTDIQSARSIHLRRLYSEVELREAALAEGWDGTFLDEAVKGIGSGGARDVATSTVMSAYRDYGTKHQIEIVYSYVRRVDEEGVTGIYCTVWSPMVKASSGDPPYGAHTLVDYAHGEYPFVLYRRERLGRDIEDGRSIPEVTSTMQMEQKEQRDSIFNRTQFDTLPPVLVPKLYGQPYRFGPAAQIQANRPDAVKFMDPIRSSPQLALESCRYLKGAADDYFGRASAEVPPDKVATKRERLVDGLYTVMTEALRQMLQLVAQYGDPQEYMRVTGSAEPLSADVAAFDIMMKWDSRELSTDFMIAKLQAMSQMVVPEDSAGVIDRAKLVMMKMRALDPSLADELIVDKGVATQKLFGDVMNQVALMALGNEAQYVVNDPTAPTKLEFLRKIVTANPKYQQGLQQDERFRELLLNYEKNLTQSVTQQQNVMTGKTGVKQIG
jgi:hypothetical protein